MTILEPPSKSTMLSRSWGHHLDQVEPPLAYLVRDALVALDLLGNSATRELLTGYHQADQLRPKLLADWSKFFAEWLGLKAAGQLYQGFDLTPEHRANLDARYPIAKNLYLLESLTQDTEYPHIAHWTLEEIMPIAPKPKVKQGNLPPWYLRQSLEELPERIEPWAKEHHQLKCLLLDIQSALEHHGPDHDPISQSFEEPEQALNDYLEMYLDYLSEIKDPDGVRSDDEIKYGTRLAWRVWQQMDRAGKKPEFLLEWVLKANKAVKTV